MSLKPVDFACPEAIDLATVAATVCGSLKADIPRSEVRVLRLLDTPDGRIGKAGFRLEAEPVGNAGRQERWRLIDAEDRARAEAAVPLPVPRFADDLPDGPLRDLLEPLAWIRALVPLFTLRLEETRIGLRDRHGKVRTRLSHLRPVVETEGSTLALAGRVRVEPLKGYERDAHASARRLTAAKGWSTLPVDLVEQATELAVSKRRGHAGPAGKPNILAAIDPHPGPSGGLHTPAGPALRRVLLHLLATMEAQRDGVIADIDSEFLHEFRVAMRRTRSALQQLRPAIPEQAAGTIADGFRWLSGETGPSRDLDVHILAFKAHRRSADPMTAATLDPLGAHLRKLKAVEHERLAAALQSDRYRSLIADWRSLLEAGDAVWSRSDEMREPIGILAGRRIMKIYKKAVHDGGRIRPDTDAEVLHALRKTMKKLRYVIEFVRDLYPKEQVKPLIRKLKDLQEVLGAVQDLEVQTDALRRFGREMARDGTAAPDTLMAIGAWIEELDRQRHEARDHFAEALAPFADRATRQAFRDTFSPKRLAERFAHAGEGAA